MSKRRKETLKFFTKNLLKGLLSFVFILGILWIASKYLPDDWMSYIEPLRDRPALIYSIFFASEVLFGLIPPEIFMVWALGGTALYYIQVIWFLTLLSYAGGIVAFFIGRFLLFRKFKMTNTYREYSRTYRRFGGVLILISAITPVPFALISMISASFGFRFAKYMQYASLRLLRFVVYGYFVWEGMNITF